MTIQSIQRTLTAQFMDLDNDDAPEVVWVAAMDYGYPLLPNSWSTSDVQLWLLVASGRTGALRWAQPLSPAYRNAAGRILPTASFNNASFELSSVDLNADGVRDLVVPLIRDDGKLETIALSGRDGTPLWRRARQEFNQGYFFENFTSASFCDFEGDGQPEVILVEPIEANANPPEVSVVALDSRGHELWSKPTGSRYANFRALSLRGGESLRPIIVHAAATKNASTRRTSRIVVQLPADRFVTFDQEGNRTDRTLEFSTSQSLGIFAYDIDHDGQEELLFMDRDTLNAVRADRMDEVIWKRKLGYMLQTG